MFIQCRPPGVKAVPGRETACISPHPSKHNVKLNPSAVLGCLMCLQLRLAFSLNNHFCIPLSLSTLVTQVPFKKLFFIKCKWRPGWSVTLSLQTFRHLGLISYNGERECPSSLPTDYTVCPVHSCSTTQPHVPHTALCDQHGRSFLELHWPGRGRGRWQRGDDRGKRPRGRWTELLAQAGRHRDPG